MGNLADMIEKYIRSMLETTQQGALELQRHELARLFDCVPSQINYVLSTRFTVDRGYVVESRRGGGGFIRIVRVSVPAGQPLHAWLNGIIESGITAKELDTILNRLVNDDHISLPEANLIKVAIMRELDGMPDQWSDILRARMLRAMLAIVVGGRGE